MGDAAAPAATGAASLAQVIEEEHRRTTAVRDDLYASLQAALGQRCSQARLSPTTPLVCTLATGFPVPSHGSQPLLMSRLITQLRSLAAACNVTISNVSCSHRHNILLHDTVGANAVKSCAYDRILQLVVPGCLVSIRTLIFSFVKQNTVGVKLSPPKVYSYRVGLYRIVF